MLLVTIVDGANAPMRDDDNGNADNVVVVVVVVYLQYCS